MSISIAIRANKDKVAGNNIRLVSKLQILFKFQKLKNIKLSKIINLE